MDVRREQIAIQGEDIRTQRLVPELHLELQAKRFG
jgi:hypothetical protein